MKLKIGRVEFEGSEEEFKILMEYCPNLFSKMRKTQKEIDAKKSEKLDDCEDKIHKLSVLD